MYSFRKISFLAILLLFMLFTSGCLDHSQEKIYAERVIIVCLDAFRYDHLLDELTPNLIELKSESISYSNCHSAGSWTKPSMTSIFTGKWAHAAGAIERLDMLPLEQTTLAEVFQAEGWETVGVIGNIVIQNIDQFGQGFDTYIEDFDKDANVLVDTALEQIDLRQDKPFLLYLHLMDTHMPLSPPEPYRNEWQQGQGPYNSNFGDIGPLIFGDLELTDGELAQVNGLYNGEAAFADFEIGRLIDSLKSRDLWENTTFVFFSDHGEEFGDHGDWTHGHCLYEEVTHVPLIVRNPGTRSSEITELTSLASLGRFVLDAAGIDGPDQFRDDYPCFSEGVKRNGEQKCLIDENGFKLIWRMYNDTIELYNIYRDPMELNNILDNNLDVVESLLVKINEVISENPDVETSEREPSAEESEHLRSIGYF